MPFFHTDLPENLEKGQYGRDPQSRQGCTVSLKLELDFSDSFARKDIVGAAFLDLTNA